MSVVRGVNDNIQKRLVRKCIILKRKENSDESCETDVVSGKQVITNTDRKNGVKKIRLDHSYAKEIAETISAPWSESTEKETGVVKSYEITLQEQEQRINHEQDSSKITDYVLLENNCKQDERQLTDSNNKDEGISRILISDAVNSTESTNTVKQTDTTSLNNDNVQGTRPYARKCVAVNCVSLEFNRKFKFPTVKISNDGNVERCKLWLKNCGNESLNVPLYDLHKKNLYLCQDHFQETDFTSSEKKRLKSIAVPTIFNCPSIDDSTMNKYLGRDHENDDTSTNSDIDLCNTLGHYAIRQFEQEMGKLNWRVCNRCKEKRLTFNSTKCSHNCSKFSSDNDMDPGEVPKQLTGLSFVEEQLIALNHPCVSFFKLKGLQYGYSGNVITFPQDVHKFVTKLPHKLKDLTHILIIKYANSAINESYFFKVRSKAVVDALSWLKANNEFYADIQICEENLQLLPEDGSVYNDLLSVLETKEKSKSVDKDLENDHNTVSKDNDQENCNVQYSGLIQNPLPHCNDQVESTLLDWPSISSCPVNEFDTPGYIACAFPTLFPTGKADLRSPRKVKINPSEYFKHLLQYYDGRFGRHPTFRFFALNSWMRWTSLTNGSLFVKRNDELADLTISCFRDLISQNKNIAKKILYQGSNLRGTRSYWYARCGELVDMVDQLGMPTVYFTLSSADLHWHDLYRLMSPDKAPDTSESERRHLLQDNPLLVDTFFSHRVEVYMKKIMKDYFKVTDYWFRFEWQSRGSPHVHGVAWIPGAPNVHRLQHASDEEKQKFIQFFDTLIQAVNPNPNIESLGNHPCRKLFQNCDNDLDDLCELLVKVQRHKCSLSYCLRKRKSTQEKSCRFNFPFVVQEFSSLEVSENGQLQFLPKRNDPNLNKCNYIVTQGWRANTDFSAVVSKEGLQLYLSKYIAKAEVSSVSFHELLNLILQDMNHDDSVKKVLGKLYIKMSSERDYSAQEVCHLLSGLKLFSAGDRRFVTVNFSKSIDWIEITDDNKKSPKKSSIEKYQNRPSKLEKISLLNVCKYYDLKTWSKKRKFNIVRVFPQLKVNNSEHKDEQYYRQRVLLHVPWRKETDLNFNIHSWKEIFETNNVSSIDDLRFNLNVNARTNENDDFEENSYSDNAIELNEEMLAARLGSNVNLSQNMLGLRTVDEECNWNIGTELYSCYGSLSELQNYISEHKKNAETNVNNIAADKSCNFIFSDEQQMIIDLIDKQIVSLKERTLNIVFDLPKRIIVQGKAGTGKSSVIMYIINNLDREFGPNSYLLLGPTGMAALNIGGETIHSAFKLPTRRDEYKELTGLSAKALCDRMESVKFVIIDEYSIVRVVVQWLERIRAWIKKLVYL